MHHGGVTPAGHGEGPPTTPQCWKPSKRSVSLAARSLRKPYSGAQIMGRGRDPESPFGESRVLPGNPPLIGGPEGIPPGKRRPERYARLVVLVAPSTGRIATLKTGLGGTSSVSEGVKNRYFRVIIFRVSAGWVRSGSVGVPGAYLVAPARASRRRKPEDRYLGLPAHLVGLEFPKPGLEGLNIGPV